MITLTIDSHYIPSQERQSESYKLKKNKFEIFSTIFTRGTPSEVAWYDIYIYIFSWNIFFALARFIWNLWGNFVFR